MTVDNFQFLRESSNLKNTFKVPQTINTLLGETNLIIFSTINKRNSSRVKNYVNVELLLEKAKNVLESGIETPTQFQCSRVLYKLAIGLRKVRGNTNQECKMITKVGIEEIMAFWQQDLFKVSEWLTYFDAFKQLPDHLQLTLLKSMWQIWCRLEHIAFTAIGRRSDLCHYKQLLLSNKNKTMITDLNHLELDLTWCSSYTIDELGFFVLNDYNKTEVLIKMIVDADPTDEELSYLLCQICFHYIKKKHPGSQISNIVDNFQEILANDLHYYYVWERATPRYCGRVARLMKINNMMHDIFYREREQKRLAHVFNIFNVHFSHPEMFRDSWETETVF